MFKSTENKVMFYLIIFMVIIALIAFFNIPSIFENLFSQHVDPVLAQLII